MPFDHEFYEDVNMMDGHDGCGIFGDLAKSFATHVLPGLAKATGDVIGKKMDEKAKNSKDEEIIKEYETGKHPEDYLDVSGLSKKGLMKMYEKEEDPAKRVMLLKLMKKKI